LRELQTSLPRCDINKDLDKLLKVAILRLFILKKEARKMVLQYKLKSASRWKDYKGKKTLELPTSKYDFRLLTSNKKKVLVKIGSYKKIMKRFRQIEFFKHH